MRLLNEMGSLGNNKELVFFPLKTVLLVFIRINNNEKNKGKTNPLKYSKDANITKTREQREIMKVQKVLM